MYVKMIVPVLSVILAVASAGLVGAPVDGNMNDDTEAQNALQYAVAQYNRASNDAFMRDVSEVIKLQKQVSAFICVLPLYMWNTSQCEGFSITSVYNQTVDCHDD